MRRPGLDLAGRRFLVTGASSGIGRATAGALASLGGRCLLLARDTGRLESCRSELQGDGHEILAFDLAECDAIPDLIRRNATASGPFAGVVHAAGITQTKPLRSLRAEDMESLHRINVTAGVMLLRGFAAPGVAARGAAFVFVGSIMSLVGEPGLVAYSSSKSALLGVVRSAALELAPKGLRVNAVLPGHVRTPMSEAVAARLGADFETGLAARHPLGIGEAEDVADSTVFLLSDLARWITGQSLVVDGGFGIA